MSSIIKFGTDGWRGHIADDYTFAAVRRCTQGFANFLLRKFDPSEMQRGVVVGYDKRFDAEHFADAVAEVLAGNGIPVMLCPTATPTPVISYNVVARKALGAVNLTASHNPSTDAGFKVRDEHGGAIDPEGLTIIESLIPENEANAHRIPLEQAKAIGLVRIIDAADTYLEHLKDLIDVQPIINAGLKIVVDPMWGNGAGWFTRILSGGKTEILEVHNQRNPLFPEMTRPEPIPPNVDAGLAYARQVKSDATLITDGDADRVGFGDENGEFVDQLRVYGLLALYLLKVRGERGPIVKTLSTTSMLDKLGKKYNVPVYNTGVGFKYVAPKMLEVDAMIGGEESGGYAFRGNVPERDGILAGLYLLDFMVKTGHTPTQLLNDLFAEVGGPHYYDRIDTRFPDEHRPEAKKRMDAANPKRIAGLKVVSINRTDGYKFNLEDGGWLLVRFSGTESIIRVYCETMNKGIVPKLLQEGLEIAGLA